MNKPVVLTISGHDPTGGAGVQADIEALAAAGCRCLSLVTALTAQDSVNVHQIWPQSADALAKQGQILLADMAIDAIKIGLLADAEIAITVRKIIDRGMGVPVVFDPVLAAGGGTDLASSSLLAAIRQHLLPATTVLTPNTPELRRLSGEDNLSSGVAALLAQGCQAILLTGGHETGGEIINTLYRPGLAARSWRWPRLPEQYHGSGCTLASALAGALAQGKALEQACEQAQQFTFQALANAERCGRGQWFPVRNLMNQTNSP